MYRICTGKKFLLKNQKEDFDFTCPEMPLTVSGHPYKNICKKF